MQINIPTLYVSFLLVSIATLVIMLPLWFNYRKRYAGLGVWVVNRLFLCLTIILILSRGISPDIIGYFGGALCAIIAGMLQLYSIALFFGQPLRIRFNTALVIIAMAIWSWYFWVSPDILFRVYVFDGLLLIHVIQSVLLFFKVDRESRSLAWPLLASLLFFGVLLIFRPTWETVVRMNPSTSWSELHSAATWGLWTMISTIFTGVSVFYLVMSRLNKELLGSELRYRQNLEQTLDDRTRSLMEAEKSASVGILAAGIAHDILNPLNIVSSAVESGTRGSGRLWEQVALCSPSCTVHAGLDPVLCDFFNTLPARGASALAACDRISRLCTDMMNLAKPELSITLKSADVCELVHTAVSLCGKQIRESTASFTLDICPQPVFVTVDSFKIEQLLINLILNACRSLENRSRSLTVRLRSEPDAAVLVVEDQGCGIDADLLKAIREPFYSTSRDSERYGLGLFIVERIVALHYGNLDIQSVPGAGTTVTVRIPR